MSVEFNIDMESTLSGMMKYDISSTSSSSLYKTQVSTPTNSASTAENLTDVLSFEADSASTAETFDNVEVIDLKDTEELTAAKLYHNQLFLRGEQLVAKVAAELGLGGPKEEVKEDVKPLDWLSQGLTNKQSTECHQV